MPIRKKEIWKRPCKRCDELFNATSKFNKICDNCSQSRNRGNYKSKIAKRILQRHIDERRSKNGN